MELAAQFEALGGAATTVDQVARSLRSEKASLQHVLDDLVHDGWQGAAADQYGQAWADWVDAADQVLTALAAESDLLDRHRVDLQATDDGVVGDISRIAQRLAGS